MTPGIRITKTELKFTEFSLKEIGLAKFCKSFTLNLDEIKLIGISPRLLLDDEIIFILIIDKYGNIYPIPDYVIDTKGLEHFEKYFKLNSIHKDWQKFKYSNHYGNVDKVMYPKEMYWNDVFNNDWKLRVRSLYSWIKPKSFLGTLKKSHIE